MNVENRSLENESQPSCLGAVSSRLFAVMADEYVILKLFWKKKDADKELEVYKREHKDALFFVEEVDVH
jgi:hypothetical protein